MKWLLTAIAVVFAAAVWSLLDPVVEPFAPSLPASSDDLPSFVEPEPEAESSTGMTPRPEVVPASEAEPADDGVINIGEPMDPDDPSTWPQSESTEVINIGEPMDPDDPSTWPEPESTEVINIGEPMDPDDPSTWGD